MKKNSTLQDFKTALIALMDETFTAQIEQGRVLLASKSLFQNEAEWCRWYTSEGLYAERQGQYMVAASVFWDSLSDSVRAQLPSNWGKIRELSRLTSSLLMKFMADHDANTMTRDQISAVVNSMLVSNNARCPRQLDLFDTFRLPPTQELVDIINKWAQPVNPVQAAEYAIAFLGITRRHLETMPNSERLECAQELRAMAAILESTEVHR